MKPGYVTRNGVPFSANATLTEYFDLVKEKKRHGVPGADVDAGRPAYMSQPMWTAVHFKKQRRCRRLQAGGVRRKVAP